jgi:flagellar hook-basal body complex protein FliE
MTMIEGVTALSAAKSTSQSLNAGGVYGSVSDAGSGGDFGQVLGQVVNEAVGTMQTGEALAIQGLQGSVPAFKVVEGVMAAQRTLQSALAIRDKAISAYQEISRMAI